MKESIPCSLPRISSLPGPRGPKGDPGDPGASGANGVSPFTTTTAAFVMPAAGTQVTVAVANTSWVAVGQPLFIESAGSFTTTAVLSVASLRLTAQAATANAAAGTAIPAGRRVVPGAQMTFDQSALDGLGNRITALENGTGNGNRSWYSGTAPSNSNGQLKTGDIWFDTAHGNKIYRWDGTGWIDVQRVLLLPDFGTGIRPIVHVATLPTSGYSDGDFVWLTTNGKLYRRVGGAWTAAVPTGDLVGQIPGAMIVNGSVIADKIAANAVTAEKIGANQIITQSANIGEGIITDAHIANLSAGKVTAGDMQAVNIGYAGRIFNPAYSSRKFRAVEYGTSTTGTTPFAFGTGSNWSFNHMEPCRVVCPGHPLWGQPGYAQTLSPDGNGIGLVQLQGRLIGYNGLATVYYQIPRLGQYVALAARNAADGDDAIVDCTRYISGLQLTDEIRFFVAPCIGTGTAPTAVSCRADIDVFCFNW